MMKPKQEPNKIKLSHLWRLMMATVLFVSTAISTPAGAFPGFGSKSNSSASEEKVQTIVLGVDGFSYAALRAAQQRGLFAEFPNVGAHVATFPSMTDLSWSTMMHTSELFGNAGRIRSVEASYFDEGTQTVQSDPRDYYRRLAFTKYYMGAFDAFFNPFVEALMYFPTDEVPKKEINSVIDDLLAAPPKKILMGYVGAVDATAHTQKDRLFPVLEELDKAVKRLIAGYKDRGNDVEVVLVSDHGNFGRFKEGGEENELLPFDIDATIKKAGLNSVDQMNQDRDVAIPRLALASWAPVYIKNRQYIPQLIQTLRSEPAFDMAVSAVTNNEYQLTVNVYSSNGSATVNYNRQQNNYTYIAHQGNPLGLPANLISTDSKLVPIASKDALNATMGTNYPDSLYRLIDTISGQNYDFPDLIITCKDGYFINNSLSKFTKMYRTHGSLSAASSYGIFISNKRKVPGVIRTKDILPSLGVDLHVAFGSVFKTFAASKAQVLNETMEDEGQGVETDSDNMSGARIFRLITKFVADTRPYFVVSEIQQLMAAFKQNPFTSSAAPSISDMSFDISKFDINSMMSPQDIGAVTDAIMKSNSPESLAQDPQIQKIKSRVESMQSNKVAKAALDKLNAAKAGNVDYTGAAVPAKRMVMKLTQIPYLLENSIDVQERPYIKDPRDLSFAQKWIHNKNSYVTNPSLLTGTDGDVLKNLFVQTMLEADLEERIYPTPVAKLYRDNLQSTTIVYIPGLYNSIFDQEIFSLGLDSLSDELGLRIIRPPVESSCSSDYNAQIILDYLHNDQKQRQQRGLPMPHYLIIGYSKGAVDALTAFTKQPAFVSSYVRGLITVAAPLHGSSILDSTDVPFALVQALSSDKIPAICKDQEQASKSVTPGAMEQFWSMHQQDLLGLTRYFSVSFVSTPEDSHIFMKATKVLAHFNEDNDGVVTLSSSKFPHGLGALDLGTLEADHLAGILSSRFNQKAFMKALVATAAELQVDNDANNTVWNSGDILTSGNAEIKTTESYSYLKKPYEVETLSIKRGNHLVSETPYSNTWELNKIIFNDVPRIVNTYVPKVKLPQSNIPYDPETKLNLQDLPKIFSQYPVTPMNLQKNPDGIHIVFNHANVENFRQDYRFIYESHSPGNPDNNNSSGNMSAYLTDAKNWHPWQSLAGGAYAKKLYDSSAENWMLMTSTNSSIRMTTLSYRFSPMDFSHLALALDVTKEVAGADPSKQGLAKDDSPFQIWFTLREKTASSQPTTLDPNKDKIFMFGYYWGSPINGKYRPRFSVIENAFSQRNLVVSTLPEIREMQLNDASMYDHPVAIFQDLAHDLQVAFPNRNVRNMEVVAITLHQDSNDTHTFSQAFFKSLEIIP